MNLLKRSCLAIIAIAFCFSLFVATSYAQDRNYRWRNYDRSERNWNKSRKYRRSNRDYRRYSRYDRYNRYNRYNSYNRYNRYNRYNSYYGYGRLTASERRRLARQRRFGNAARFSGSDLIAECFLPVRLFLLCGK